MKPLIRGTARAACEAIGRSPVAAVALQALAITAKLPLVPSSAVGSAAARIAAGGRATSVRTRLPLPYGASARIECDLRFEMYREIAFEPERVANELALRLFVALARRSDLAIDVGANAGVFSYAVAAAAPTVRIVAFEPIPALAASLRRNTELNRWMSRLDVRQELVGARPGQARFFVLASDMESTADPERAALGEIRAELVVPVVTLDDLIRTTACSPARTVVKIDVEGHEAAVLAGAVGSLALEMPPELVIEFLGKAVQAGAVEAMVGRGFDVYYIAPDRLVSVRAVSEFVAHQDLSCWNFYCTRQSEADVRRLAMEIGVPVVAGSAKASSHFHLTRGDSRGLARAPEDPCQ